MYLLGVPPSPFLLPSPAGPWWRSALWSTTSTRPGHSGTLPCIRCVLVRVCCMIRLHHHNPAAQHQPVKPRVFWCPLRPKLCCALSCCAVPHTRHTHSPACCTFLSCQATGQSKVIVLSWIRGGALTLPSTGERFIMPHWPSCGVVRVSSTDSMALSYGRWALLTSLACTQCLAAPEVALRTPASREQQPN